MPAQELQPLYDKYHSVLKPLIAEYESRNEDFVTPLLIDLPDMFDHVALYEDTREGSHISKAMYHLDKAIEAVRTCLVGSMIEAVERFRSRFPDTMLMTLDGGKFYGEFTSLERQLRECKDADLERAYKLLKEMDSMMQSAHASSLSSGILIDSPNIVCVKWIISIVVALIVNLIIFSLA